MLAVVVLVECKFTNYHYDKQINADMFLPEWILSDQEQSSISKNKSTRTILILQLR